MEPSLNLLTRVLAAAETHGGEGGGHATVSIAGVLFYFGLVLAVLFGLMVLAYPGLKGRVFLNPWTQRFEQLYLFVQNLVIGTVGPHGRKYIPIVMTFWMVIFVGNLIALFFPTSITADLSFNLGMALIAIGYVQWEGIKSNGVAGHFSHFAGPRMPGILILVNGMIFIIELISELMKNVSLSLRLYGNIDGGHRASDSMSELGYNIIRINEHLALSIPFGSFLLPIKMLTVVVQALIFCLLFCVYLSLVTHHSEEHAEHDHAPTGQEPAPAH